ncbi:MAG: MYG1 family protein, partial [Bacteroidota bacterium]
MTLPDKSTIVLGTHNANFHLDDLFSCAILQILTEKAGKKTIIVRSRDEHELAKADIVFDVGGKYDSETLRFDHHQSDFTEVHDGDIPFSALSLIWRHFGQEFL